MPKPIKNNKTKGRTPFESLKEESFSFGRMSRSGSLIALIGLIIVFASSLVMAGGRKPPEMYPKLHMAQLSAEERQLIDNAYLQSGAKGKTVEYQRRWEKFEIHPLLNRVFPAVQFYILYSSFTEPATAYIMGFSNGKFYNLPSDFNRLLLDNGLEVNNKNIIELAKAFVVMAIMETPPVDKTKPYWWEKFDGVPQITFLEGKSSVDKKKDPPIYRVHLKVKVINQKQIYGFHIRKGQFQWVTMDIEGVTTTKWFDLEVIEDTLKKRGELDLEGQIKISTTSPSKAYLEPGDIYHYYLIVDTNGFASKYPVEFKLSGFQPNQQDIAILVRCINQAYADTLLFQPVNIDENGNDSFLWTPSSQYTCITNVWAIDTITFDSTRSQELTLEKVKTQTFPNSGDDAWVYYTDQFFYTIPNDTCDTIYAKYVLDATLASWDYLVNNWNFDPPYDTNQIHQIFLGDDEKYYHGKLTSPAIGHAERGKNRRIRIADDFPRAWPWTEYNSSEKVYLTTISHEFYHGIQFRYNEFNYANGDSWKYFIEGQAKFIQSVVCSDKELESQLRDYPVRANAFLDSLLNASLKTITYPYCLYWRFLFEKFNQGTTPQGLNLIREAYKWTDSVGTNPIIDGAKAIDSALAHAQDSKPFTTFAQSIDSFANACYLKDFNPDSIYVKPFVEARCTLFTITDSFVRDNSIPVSFGIDYYEFIAKASSVGKVKFSFDQEDLLAEFCLGFIIFNHNDTKEVVKFNTDTTLDCRTIDSLVVRITRLDTLDDIILGRYTLKAKVLSDMSTDSIEIKPYKIKRQDDLPVFSKGYKQSFSIPKITVGFSNKEGRDDSLKTKLQIIRQSSDSLCYDESLKIYLRLDSTRLVIFPRFTTTFAGTYKITAFTNLPNDTIKTNDTVTGYFVVQDTFLSQTQNKDSVIHEFYEEFPEWPARNWVARHWSWHSSCWHLRKGPDWTWTNDTTNYMCLRWHDRGHCYETLYSPSVVCSKYDTVWLKFRVNFTPSSTCQCTARLVYSTNGGQTWPYILTSYSTQLVDVTQLFRLDSAAHKSRVKIAWTYAGDSTDIRFWCIDDVRIYGSPITAFDVAPKEISWPFDKIAPNDSHNIWFIIRNIGASNAYNIKAEAWIGEQYSEKTINQLPPFTDSLVRLKITAPSEGNYLMKVITKFNNDIDDCLDNDTLSDSLVVIDSFWEPVCQYPLGKTKSSASLAIEENSDSIYFWGGRNVLLFYQYFPRSNQWDTLARLLMKVTKGFLVMVGDSVIYLMTKRKKPLCRYHINSNPAFWDTLHKNHDRKISNPSACWDKGNYIYCLRGSSKDEIYRFKISDKDWDKTYTLPYGYKIKGRGGITSKDSNNIYIMGIKHNMGKLLLFHPHFESNYRWDTLKSLPLSQSTDKVREIFYADDRIYVLRDYSGGDSGKMWYYNINDNSWVLASPTLPNWPPYVRKKRLRRGACLTIWKDGETHYGYILSGRERRMLKFYPKPIPYTDEYLGLGIVKMITGYQDQITTTYETEHFLPKFLPSSDSIICFYEDTTENYYRLSKMDLQGNENQMVMDDANYERPSYTPDGSWIIAVKDNIVTKISSDGSQEEALSTGFCDEPVVSPLGEKAVYTKLKDGHHCLYQVTLGGSVTETPLTEPGYSCNSPQFSSDGNKIVYEKYVNGYTHIYTYSFETQEENEILGGDHYHYFNPRFSPDGNWVVCERVDNEECSQICRASTVIDSFELLTSDDYDYEYPSFTPDGEYIVCVKWCGDGSAICQISVSSGDATILTDSNTIRLYPEVSPNGKCVTYEVQTEDMDGREVNGIGLVFLTDFVGISEEEHFGLLPKVFVLYQNRPNPFQNATRIKYGLPQTAKVKLTVYNIAGRVVKKLVDEEQKEGYYNIIWNGKDNRESKLPSGVYFYRLESEKINLIKKIVMTK